MTVELNDNERKVFDACYRCSEGNGHDFAFRNEIAADVEGLSRHQVAGYMASLAAKNLIHTNTGEPDIFEIRAEGHELIGNDLYADQYRKRVPGLYN